VLSLFVTNFLAYMIYLKINYILWHKCFNWGGMLVGKLGSGRGGYKRGRRSWKRSVGFYC